MPAATSHVEFARDVYSRLPLSFQSEIRDLHLYYLGSQGPDLFFFSRAAVLPGTLRPYGVLLHHAHVREALDSLREYADRVPAMKSYYDGFLTHYVLDSTCHPIIRWYAHMEAEQSGRSELETHFEIEAELDIWQLQRKGRSPESYDVFKDLRISDEDRAELGRMYHIFFSRLLHISIPARRFSSCTDDIVRETRSLRPDSALKYKTIVRLEDLVHAPHPISAMMLTGKSGKDPAVLNPDHSTFHDTEDPALNDHRSFAELYEEALGKATGAIQDGGIMDPASDYLGRPIKK